MITNKVPATWNELQDMVGNILRNCEFIVQVEKKTITARGIVEVDVFAVEDVNGRKYSIACECKYWKSAIPQSVIHGFRTVVNDLGCNVGYIITTSDFQSGAVLSTQYTNVQLLTWREFQQLFQQSWYLKYFCKEAQQRIRLPHDWQWVYSIIIYGKKEADLFLQLRAKISWLDDVRFKLQFDNSGNYWKEIVPPLPLKNTYLYEWFFSTDDLKETDPAAIAAREELEIRQTIFEETAFQELLDRMIVYGNDLIVQLQRLRSRCKKP